MYDEIKEILISEKEFTETNYKRLQEVLVYIKNNLIDTNYYYYYCYYYHYYYYYHHHHHHHHYHL